MINKKHVAETVVSTVVLDTNIIDNTILTVQILTTITDGDLSEEKVKA